MVFGVESKLLNRAPFVCGFPLGDGRPEEAIEEVHQALDLDPLSLVINMEVGWNFYMAREYDRAVEHLSKTLEMEPDFSPAQHVLGLAYEQPGRFEEATDALQSAWDASGGNPASVAAIGHVHVLAGRREEAVTILNRLEELAQQTYVSPYFFALVYAGMGENERGFQSLESAPEERDVWLVWLKRDPRFDGMRSLPHFAGLLKRMGMEP